MDSETLIKGGRQLHLSKQDGTTIPAIAPLLKIKQFPEYFSRLEDEEALVAHFLGLTPEQVAELTVASVLDAAEAIHDLNFQEARRWGERRAALSEEMLPMAERGRRIAGRLPASPRR